VAISVVSMESPANVDLFILASDGCGIHEGAFRKFRV